MISDLGFNLLPTVQNCVNAVGPGIPRLGDGQNVGHRDQELRKGT